MKRLARVVLLSCCLALAATPEALAPFNQRVQRELLAASKGQVVLFDFWASWCPPCRAEMPHLVRLEQKLRDRGFRLITVSADEPEDKAAVLALLRKNNVPGPVFIKSTAGDDAFISAIDPKWNGALPALFLYDRQGKLAGKFIGETPIEILEKAIRSLL